MRKTYLPLSDEDRDYLKALSQKRTIQAQVVDRARILLYKADGMTFQQIADKLAISTATVRLCISKFQKGGLDAALFDVQRPGRPSEITDDAKAWMIHIACQRPNPSGTGGCPVYSFHDFTLCYIDCFCTAEFYAQSIFGSENQPDISG